MSKFDRRITLTDFGQVFRRALEGTRSDQASLDPYVKFAKLQEECGEFAEACMHRDRWVWKNKPGTPIEEGADMILMILDILSDQYADTPPDQLVAALEFELMRKLLKWEKYMKKPDGRTTHWDNIARVGMQ